MAQQHATGAHHPITDPEHPWELPGGLRAWMAATDPQKVYPDRRGPFVILEEENDGNVIVLPHNQTAILGRGLIAAHVEGCRSDRWPK